MDHRILSEGGILSGVLPLADSVNLFLVQTVIIIGITRGLSLLSNYLKQPRVIFEVIGGVLLGPSALGRIPNFLNKIFPTASLQYLNLVSNVGLILYLFLVGMELDPELLATHAKRAGSIALTGMALPFALGIAISKTLYDKLLITEEKYANVKFSSFYVFVGTAMSITAFPVLARILKETGLIYSRPGVMTMGAAALNDAVAWCLLILAISIANAGDMITAFYVFLCVVCFALGLFFLVNPVFSRIVAYCESPGANPAMRKNLFAFTICITFLAAWTTSLLGVHYIFGPFLFGLIIPRKSHLFHECTEHIEEFVLTIMLPLYFALSGLKTDVTKIDTGTAGGLLILVIFVATAGKMVACGLTAYLSGLHPLESAVVATLMNTRGLVELIVLNLGLQAGVLNIPIFTIMVLMALVTTFMTGPIVEIIYPAHKRQLMNAPDESDLKQEESLVGGDQSPAVDSYTVDVSITELTKEARVSVILDKPEHIPGLLDVLYLFAPMKSTADLAVRAIQFVEPTLTERDKFLGLSEGNRVIHVEKKNASMNLTSLHNSDLGVRATLHEYLELLPLSMFCSAVGAKNVDVYRVMGDPDEFPEELRSLADDQASNLVILPWRTGDYIERLFWNSVFRTHCPIALIAQVGPNAASGVSTAATNQLPTINEAEEDGVFPEEDKHDDRSRGRSVNDSVVRRTIQKILVVAAGSDMDAMALLIAQRFVEKPNIALTVAIVGDQNMFPSESREAVQYLLHEVPRLTNVTVKALSTAFPLPAEDLVARECLTTPYDMVIMGFLEPAESDVPRDGEIETTEASTTGEGEDLRAAMQARASIRERGRSVSTGGPGAGARGRSASIGEALFMSFQHLLQSNTSTDRYEHRRALGMGDLLARCDLLHPELGAIGDKISRLKWAQPTFLCVLHSPRDDNRRRRTNSQDMIRRRTLSFGVGQRSTSSSAHEEHVITTSSKSGAETPSIGYPVDNISPNGAMPSDGDVEDASGKDEPNSVKYSAEELRKSEQYTI